MFKSVQSCWKERDPFLLFFSAKKFSLWAPMWKNQFSIKKKSGTVSSTLKTKSSIKIQITKFVKSRGIKVIKELLHKFEKITVMNFMQL